MGQVGSKEGLNVLARVLHRDAAGSEVACRRRDGGVERVRQSRMRVEQLRRIHPEGTDTHQKRRGDREDNGISATLVALEARRQAFLGRPDFPV